MLSSSSYSVRVWSSKSTQRATRNIICALSVSLQHRTISMYAGKSAHSLSRIHTAPLLKILNNTFQPKLHQKSDLRNFAKTNAHLASLKLVATQSKDNENEFTIKLENSSSPIEVSIKDYPKRAHILTLLLKYGLSFVLIAASLALLSDNGISPSLSIAKNASPKSYYETRLVKNTSVTLDDVKGCNEVKEEVQQVISYLTDPQKFAKIGAKLPKGILLYGAPGTGKTLIARAIAGEANVPFIQVAGSEFEEMYVGVGAKRIRALFKVAQKLAPAIIFIDEIDSIGCSRNKRDSASGCMALNQLLIELDGFEKSEGVVLICATNKPECLDSALTRPGRLDRMIHVPSPDLGGRLELLEYFGKSLLLAPTVDLKILAQRSIGMTGADLFNIMNSAAIKCAVEGQTEISMQALDQSFDREVVGSQRQNLMSDEEKKMTAYHEAGHALASLLNENADPVHKVTIAPRGNSLGVTWQIPEEDRYQKTLNQLKATLNVLMAGKAAEVLIYGVDKSTAGCSSDLKEATLIARNMITQYGMGDSETHVPMSINTKELIAQKTLQRVDQVVQNLLNTAYDKAFELLKNNKKSLDAIAQALLEYETLTRQEIELVMKDKSAQIFSIRQAEIAKQIGNK